MTPIGIQEDDHWAPVSDMMAALMLIFMFIAIVFVREVLDEESTNLEECHKLRHSLLIEFQVDFENWEVSLLDDLTIQFRNPEVLFETGDADYSRGVCDDSGEFFPRYMEIVQREDYRHDVREIRIEGHTSSEWAGAMSPDAYYLNMDLSQRRTQES